MNALAVSTDPIAVNGSGFRQTFNAPSGSPLSFRWNFLTDDNTPSVTYNDYAFAVIDGVPIKLADTYFAFTASSTGYASETGYQTFNFVLGSGATHSIGFGVMNVSDDFVGSAVLIDNVSLSIAAVPEPSTYALMLAGLGFVGFVANRRRKSQGNSAA